MRVSALSLGLWVGDDDVDAGQEFSGLHEGQRVGGAPLRQRHPVVPKGPEVQVHRRGVGRAGAL